MGIAHYNSKMAAMPSELRFSGEGELFPVSLFYNDDEAHHYAKGGLVKEAAKVRSAGRYGDTETVHINKEELKELTEMWGPPTINPQTGMPEFFLKKAWKKIKKVAKPLASVAQIALPFIPGVGPLSSIALQAGLGGVTGGLKGALTGGLTGAMGAGLGGKLGSATGLGKVGGNALLGGVAGAIGGGAKGAIGGALTGGMAGGLGEKAGKLTGIKDPRVATALGNALVGGAASGVMGGNPLIGALGSGAASYAMRAGVPVAGGAGLSPELQQAARTPIGTPTTVDLPGFESTQLSGIAPSGGVANLPGLVASNRNSLGWTPLTTSERLLAAVPGAVAANTRSPKSKSDFYDLSKDPYSKLPSVYGSQMPAANGIYTNLGARDMSGTDWENYGYGPGKAFFNYANGYARGGQPERAPRESFAVSGRGSGRSDDIPAMLSDGEYVIDAETVALLGDGSNAAGAKKLDDFRVNVRKHKGSALRKGKISPNAKRAEAYMNGGSVRG